MSPLDKQLIVRKIKLIEDDLKILIKYKKITFDEYRDRIDIKLQVERLLEKIVSRLIDINYHILKEEFQFIPKDYYNSFAELGKKEFIDKDMSLLLAKSSGLRNALAHEYDELDDFQVFKSIKLALTDIPIYLQKILQKIT